MALRLLISLHLLLFAGTSYAADDALRLPDMTVQTQTELRTADSRLDNTVARGRELAELLNQAAGVRVRSSGGLGAYSEASLRGSSARQVQILFDGVPLELAGGQAINLALFPAAIVEYADVYRGGTPLGIASGAAGAINLRPVDSNLTRRRLDTHYGSFASWRTSALGSGPKGLLSLGFESSDNDFPIRNPFKPFDPEDPQRQAKEPRQHAAVDQYFGLWRKNWSLPRHDLKALLYGFSQQQQLPDRVNSSAPQTRLNSDLVLADLSLLAEEQSQFSLQLQQHRQHFADPGSRIGLGRQDQVMQSRRIGFRYLAQQDTIAWQLRAIWQDYNSRNALASEPDNLRAGRYLIGADGLWKLQVNNWIVDARLQLDYFDESSSSRNTTPIDAEWMIQPQLNWRRQQSSSCQLGGQLGLREHPAGFVERFGDRGYVRGNPQLRSERLLATDLGVNCQSEIGHIRGSVFAQDLRDAISFVYDARGAGRAQNTQRARIYGVELESTLEFGQKTHLSISGTWLETEDRSQVRGSRGRQLPGRARWQAFARLQHQIASHPRCLLFHEFEFAASQYYDSSNLLKAPTTRLHHSGISLQLKSLMLALEARNWLDQTHAQFNGFPRPGRSWQLSLHLDFDPGEAS